jgi:hypothetical protein
MKLGGVGDYGGPTHSSIADRELKLKLCHAVEASFFIWLLVLWYLRWTFHSFTLSSAALQHVMLSSCWVMAA